jgi:anti-anti-sigma regulatory factor
MESFPSSLEFSYAGKMKSQIERLMAGSQSVLIDLEHVHAASFACLQILLAAKRKAARERVTLVIHVSDSLSRILEQTGLESIVQNERGA